MGSKIEVTHFPSATVLSHAGNGRHAVVSSQFVRLYSSADDYVAKRPTKVIEHEGYTNGLQLGREYLSS